MVSARSRFSSTDTVWVLKDQLSGPSCNLIDRWLKMIPFQSVLDRKSASSHLVSLEPSRNWWRPKSRLDLKTGAVSRREASQGWPFSLQLGPVRAEAQRASERFSVVVFVLYKKANFWRYPFSAFRKLKREPKKKKAKTKHTHTHTHTIWGRFQEARLKQHTLRIEPEPHFSCLGELANAVLLESMLCGCPRRICSFWIPVKPSRNKVPSKQHTQTHRCGAFDMFGSSWTPGSHRM